MVSAGRPSAASKATGVYGQLLTARLVPLWLTRKRSSLIRRRGILRLFLLPTYNFRVNFENSQLSPDGPEAGVKILQPCLAVAALPAGHLMGTASGARLPLRKCCTLVSSASC